MARKIKVVQRYCKKFRMDFGKQKHGWIGYVLTAKDETNFDRKLENCEPSTQNTRLIAMNILPRT